MVRKNTTLLLKSLRKLMTCTETVPCPIGAYIVPHGDSHQNEYIAACDERLSFITGFSGSAGVAVITRKEAALWTDGRYFLQASQQMDENWTLMKQGLPNTPTEAKWLIKQLPQESSVGVDPYLVDSDLWNELSKELGSHGCSLVPVTNNLVDLVWKDDRPSQPKNPVFPLEEKFTGLDKAIKIENVREKLKEEDADCLIITALDEIAYLYNLRGSDIDYNPLFFSYAVVTIDEAFLFIDESQLTSAALKSLNIINVQPYESAMSFFSKLHSTYNGKIWIPNKSSYAVSNLINKDRKITKCSPIALMKAIKNATEIKGLDWCHVRDGAAVCRYLNWLEKEAPLRKQTEISGADYLQKLREEQADYVGLSFTTISSVGPNAAIIHYSPSKETDRVITCDEIYLVDSGGQYKDGTTDITRTVHFGNPSQYERECFTRVLKGHISLAMAVFPEKIKGNCLDSFARKALWDVGLNYKHGTGHGIGMYLNVHEGPMGISWRPYPDDPGLQEGMYLSDEPGYYEDGKFGIRIESIIRVIKADTKYPSQDVNFLTFKPVTLVPIQTKLIDPSLLTKVEIDWINNYHSECLEKVGALLLQQGFKNDYNWLKESCLPIS